MRHTYWSSSLSLPYIIKLSQIVWELWPAQDFGFRGDNNITKKVIVVFFVRDMSTGPPLYSYQILSKYVYRYQSYGVHKDAPTDGQTDTMLIAISPEPIGQGIKMNESEETE